MPTYEYECRVCSTRFELKRGFGEETNAYCPACAGEARRIFSPVPIFFKGSGFYVTDNAKGNGRKKTDTELTDKAEKKEEHTSQSDQSKVEACA